MERGGALHGPCSWFDNGVTIGLQGGISLQYSGRSRREMTRACRVLSRRPSPDGRAQRYATIVKIRGTLQDTAAGRRFSNSPLAFAVSLPKE